VAAPGAACTGLALGISFFGSFLKEFPAPSIFVYQKFLMKEKVSRVAFPFNSLKLNALASNSRKILLTLVLSYTTE